jgi:hypothetical protein
MATLADLRERVAAGDWEGVTRMAKSLRPTAAPEDFRRELESILEMARGRRRELSAALARVQAANGFTRQGFGASPGF